MNVKERYRLAIEWFQEHMPEAKTELHYTNPYELLVAVILSAQCTDKRVNMVTPALFQHYPDAPTLAQATFEEVEPFVRSISFANNKTKHLLGMAQMLVERYKNLVPDTIEELINLPGVGRKTANVIISIVYNKPGMAVDTHVFRVSDRIGLTTRAKTPRQAEDQLVAHLPENLIVVAHHWLILHGRYTCVARKPKCSECGLQSICRHYEYERKKTGE
jgi:endonuclease III